MANLGEGPYGNLDKRIEMRTFSLEKKSIEGRGLFATEMIPKKTIIWVNKADGPMNVYYSILTFEELRQLQQEHRDCVLKYGSQLSDNTIQGPLTENVALLDYANFFNHSCSPNVWPVDVNHWEARCNINIGDELTIDYATFDSNEFSGLKQCLCNSPECRGEIKQDDYKDINLQKKYEGHFVNFIQTLIDLHNKKLSNPFVALTN